MKIERNKNKIVSVPIPTFKKPDVGKIVKWNFQIGDFIKNCDIICEIEYSLFNVDVMSEYNGKLISINKSKIFSSLEKPLYQIEKY
jgi:glycine cleavage system H lipoate-binding protein